MAKSGFRYKPREIRHTDEKAIKREFENIATTSTSVNRTLVFGSGGGSGGSAPAAGGGGDSGGGTDTDERVKVSPTDPVAGYLETKIVAATPNVHIHLGVSYAGGEYIGIGVDLGVVHLVIPFDETRHLHVDHILPNAHYHVSVDRPQDDGALCPVPWATIRKYPNALDITFDSPEFGYVSLIGSTGPV